MEKSNIIGTEVTSINGVQGQPRCCAECGDSGREVPLVSVADVMNDEKLNRPCPLLRGESGG